MKIRRLIGEAVRKVLSNRGYELMHRDAMRFGIDPVRDVRLLAGRVNKSIDVCFDVGANEGQSALAMRDEFPEATIYSFEPVASTFEQLKTRTQGEARIRPHMLALSDEAKTTQIYTYESSLLASLNPEAPYSSRTGAKAKLETCTVQTLDQFCSDNGVDKIDYLKIDTEANDLKVLAGASRMLHSGVSFVSVEINSFDKARELPSLQTFNEVLAPLGYRCIGTYVDEIHVDMDFMIVANAMFAHADRLVR